MVTLNPDILVFQGQTQDDGIWKDYCFTDKGRKGIRRIWSLSVPYGQDSAYTLLRRSETDDSEFGQEIVCPDGITDVLISLLPKDN